MKTTVQKIQNLVTQIKNNISEIELLLPELDLTTINTLFRNVCADCENWNRNKNVCDKYKQVPPPHIIMNPELCEGFKSDDIPF